MPRRKDALGIGGPGKRRLFTLGDEADARLRGLGDAYGLADAVVVRRLILAPPELLRAILGPPADDEPVSVS